MAQTFLRRVVVPVANREDATATAAALRPHLSEDEATVVALHGIEKAGGALDKASVEQRERDARAIFAAVAEALDDSDVELETRIRYGTDVAATIVDAAHEADATAIVFTPRGGSHWAKFLSGDVTHNLVSTSDVPILVLPDESTVASENPGAAT